MITSEIPVKKEQLNHKAGKLTLGDELFQDGIHLKSQVLYLNMVSE